VEHTTEVASTESEQTIVAVENEPDESMEDHDNANGGTGVVVVDDVAAEDVINVDTESGVDQLTDAVVP
jgi:hypothetical protein